MAGLRAREELVEQGLSALHLFELDRHYILAEDKVQIVDEYTGRVMADRSWEKGLHQMIEVKEGLDLTKRRDTISRITYQRYFRRYLRLAGMSGTVTEVAPEMRTVPAGSMCCASRPTGRCSGVTWASKCSPVARPAGTRYWPRPAA